MQQVLQSVCTEQSFTVAQILNLEHLAARKTFT